MDNVDSALLEKTQAILCAPHLQLVCQCAGLGSCGGCKIFKLSKEWIKAFGEKPCQHPKTWKAGLFSNPRKQCIECRAILGPADENDL